MAKTPKKTRNPNDATFRNINALKKRVQVLEGIIDAILFCVEHMQTPFITTTGIVSLRSKLPRGTHGFRE